MRRLRALVEYDGTGFRGFQRQPDRRTVQGALEAALSRVCGHAVQVHGAGRTDAGVHALGQVVHWETTGSIPRERIAPVVSGLLGGEVVVRHVEETGQEFHARYSAVRRTYHYYLCRERPTPYQARFAAWEEGLGEDAAERMRAALRFLEGRRDFAPLADGDDESAGTVRTVYSTGVLERGSAVRLEIAADGFLRSMVRRVVGLVLEVGRGRETPDVVARVLEEQRRPASVTASPQGLCLVRVDYPDGFPGAFGAELSPFRV